jgi:hypothetical protein
VDVLFEGTGEMDEPFARPSSTAELRDAAVILGNRGKQERNASLLGSAAERYVQFLKIWVRYFKLLVTYKCELVIFLNTIKLHIYVFLLLYRWEEAGEISESLECRGYADCVRSDDPDLPFEERNALRVRAADFLLRASSDLLHPERARQCIKVAERMLHDAGEQELYNSCLEAERKLEI